MQVKLHGSACIPGVSLFLYCFGNRKNEIKHQESTKIRHFDPKIFKKNFWEGDTPYPHPAPLGAFGASTRLAPSALDLGPQLLDPPMSPHESILKS